MYLCDKIKKNEGAGHVAILGDRRSAHRTLVGKPKGQTPHGRPSHGGMDGKIMLNCIL